MGKDGGGMDIAREVPGIDLEQDMTALENIIFRLSWVSHRFMEQELDEYNLTAPQYVALKSMQRSEIGCSMSELAESSQQVSATMTGIVDRLLDRGLVERERDPNDRRTQRVRLTVKGKETLSRVQMQKRSWLRQFLSTLTADERRMMIGMAQRYLVVLENSYKTA
jgi:DNA-binding MarR family transcriptional regulator